jgi:hypothetical protein
MGFRCHARMYFTPRPVLGAGGSDEEVLSPDCYTGLAAVASALPSSISLLLLLQQPRLQIVTMKFPFRPVLL